MPHKHSRKRRESISSWVNIFLLLTELTASERYTGTYMYKKKNNSKTMIYAGKLRKNETEKYYERQIRERWRDDFD